MTNLRKHAFLTSRGLEYRECGQWKIEEFSPLLFPSLDAILARLYSANRAIWILDDQMSDDIRDVAHVGGFLSQIGAMPQGRNIAWNSTRFDVKRNASPSTFDNEEDEPDDTITALARRETDASLIDASERVSFRPCDAPEQTRDCQLFFPGKAENWGFSEEDDPDVIERALTRLQDHFGRSLVYPPGRLAIYLMEASRERAAQQVDYKRPPKYQVPYGADWERIAEHFLTGQDDLEEPREWMNPFEQWEEDLDWKRLRSLSISERQMKYVHAFDKNAAFLQAVGIPLGIGNYNYVMRPHVTDKPGLWCVKSLPYFQLSQRRDLAVNHGPELEGQFNPPGLQGAAPFAQWVTTPILKLLCDLDLILDIEAAWLAEDEHKLFPTYYSHIKQALNSEIIERRNSEVIGRMMRRFTKAIYTKGIGYLRADFAREAGEWFYRPDWWAHIVSEATARIFRDAIAVNKAHSAWPIAAYIDCLYYVSDEPDAFKAFPIFKDKFGNKFKHKGTCELTPELINAYAERVTPGAFGGLFKRAERGFVYDGV